MNEAATVPAEFHIPLRVYIEDTDAGGIVYYVNYLKYFERARTEHMRALGFGKQALLGQDIMFVVHSLNVDYRRSAELDDELEVFARVTQCGRASLLFRQGVLRNGEEICGGEISVACVDPQTRKPRALPKAVRERINTVLNPSMEKSP